MVTIYTFMTFNVLYTRVKSVWKAHDKNQGLSRWGHTAANTKKTLYVVGSDIFGGCHK